MPRAGLNTTEVVACGAELADQAGIESVTLAALAERLGVKPPSLYKHVNGIADLQHRIATAAMTELGDALRDTLQGKSRADAIAALFTAFQSFVADYPGRYSATISARFEGPGDPLLTAATRIIDSIRAVLSGYGIQPDELDHAIRALRSMTHGYAMLQATNAFHWDNDPDESLAWMTRFADAGLAAVGDKADDRQAAVSGHLGV